jgi:hypothetical protein
MTKEKAREYREKNWLQIKMKRATPEVMKRRKEYLRKWREDHIEWYKAYQKEYQRKYRVKHKAEIVDVARKRRENE